MDEQVQNEHWGEELFQNPLKCWKTFLLDENNPEKFTRIGTSMKDEMKQDVVQFPRKSIDVFA